MEGANKWHGAEVVPAPAPPNPVEKWEYTKGLLMTIEGSRLKAHMIQTLYRKAKESELGGWNIRFSNDLVKDSLIISLQKALPTFDASHRVKFPELTDEEGIEAFFQKIKANFEKGRLKTYMREQSNESNGLGPPLQPEGPEPDLEMTDSKIIHHKTWLQNYAYFVCLWMDRSGRNPSKKRSSTGGTGNNSPNLGGSARKRQRTSLGQPMDHFANIGTGRGLTSIPGMVTSNLELGAAMPAMPVSSSDTDALIDTMQFGFKCIFSMVAASTPIENLNRMQLTLHNMNKEAESRQGVNQDRAKQIIKSMSDAITVRQQLF